jgi:hypothetical protein
MILCRGNREGKPRVLLIGWRWSGGGGEDTPTEPESSDEEGEMTPPPLSPARMTVPPLNDIIGRQVGITIGIRRPKRT